MAVITQHACRISSCLPPGCHVSNVVEISAVFSFIHLKLASDHLGSVQPLSFSMTFNMIMTLNTFYLDYTSENPSPLTDIHPTMPGHVLLKMIHSRITINPTRVSFIEYCCGLFNDAVSSSDYIASNSTLLVHDPESMWKIGVMTYNPGTQTDRTAHLWGKI